jgi:hypothetical protein
VRGDQDKWTAAKQSAHERFQIDDPRVLAPVGAVDFPRRLRDLGTHQEQVPPHSPGDLVAIRFGEIRKGDSQILVDHVLADSQHAAEESRQNFGPALANLEGHGLHDRGKNPHDEVDAEIDSSLPHGLESFPKVRSHK